MFEVHFANILFVAEFVKLYNYKISGDVSGYRNVFKYKYLTQ